MEHGKTLVIGVGEVGGALAEVLERKEAVLRHDIKPRNFADAIGVMHICIPFKTREQFEPAALSYINRFSPTLTIINSTVVPGTTRSIAAQSRTPIAYSPVRGKHVRMTEDMLHYAKFVSAPDSGTADLAEEHFKAAGMKTRRFARVETLELAKLAETSYFGVMIAFAQELNRYAETVGADYAEAIDFFEEVGFLPRTRYFPGFIGGHCVIPNIHLLKQVKSMALFDAVLDSNERRAAELRRKGPSNQAETSNRTKPAGKKNGIDNGGFQDRSNGGRGKLTANR
ncbi:MAG: GDP-mannose dehydrogenase [Candidatus Binataceae bacterium]